LSERWPERLWIVRHGESSGNIARDAATSAGRATIEIAERDVDVPLSELGKEQSAALGDWFAGMDESERPTSVITSTYLRARQTASIIVAAGGVHPQSGSRVDERLREREFGILDRLTRVGIEQRFPEQAAARARVGKFYHRPPGGESWCDVILRLRSVLDTISLHYSRPGSRVLIVAHQVIVLCFRYLIEELTEDEILEIDKASEVANCGVTEYRRAPRTEIPATEGARLQLVRYNFVAPLEEAGAAVTAEPDTPAGPR
jgi:2,3-bisphosphoglycerate-dependent phosphoglycerate mutase